MGSALGHRFRRPGLLAEALTHPSAAGPSRPDNQRLEFLGDRVLGLVVAEALMEALPEEAEGTLAPRLNALVRRETLAEIAGELGLGAHLVLGRSENISGGRRKKAILADAMEAVIAAIYLDGGLEAARGFVRRHWLARLTAAEEAPIDAKTRLQEWAQGRGMAPPSYTLEAQEGPAHDPEFTVSATLADGQRAEGRARAKKVAEQAAAEALLARLAGDAGT
ncbi:MAG: ribonuclease III [Pseudomonadota bacterium]